MSDTEIELVRHLDEVNKVVEEYLKGNDPTKISKNLALPRTRVVAHLNEWKTMASANDAIRARAKDALVAADAHYTRLIQQAYEVIDDASTTANLNAKTAAIKLVMDIEGRRIDMLQKAGLRIGGWSADDTLVEMVEIPDHPWFVACQFHPEFTSTPRDGHPLFTSFVSAALANTK